MRNSAQNKDEGRRNKIGLGVLCLIAENTESFQKDESEGHQEKQSRSRS